MMLRGIILLTLLSGSVPASEAWAQASKRPLSGGGHYTLFVPPRQRDPSSPHAAVIALHGAGDTAENFARFLIRTSGNPSLILAVPEASHKLGSGFTWGSDDVTRIAETRTDLIDIHGVDPQRVMLFGFSAGCVMGFHVISQRPNEFVCFAGIGAGIPPDRIPEAALAKAAPYTAICYVVGKKDPSHSSYQSTLDLLDKHQFRVESDDPPGVGHALTPRLLKRVNRFFDKESRIAVKQGLR